MTTILIALVLAPAAQAHSTGAAPRTKQEQITFLRQAIKHHRYVCKHGKGKVRRWHCAALQWTRRELRERLPVFSRSMVHPCLRVIIDRETAGTWNPQVYNYQGSGAYGLPQALPGSKMASAGSDWRTNPLTQVRWMMSYTVARYGGPCQALAYHTSHGHY